MSRRTPLYPLHQEANARIIDFGGWDMPVQYDSIPQEHQYVRENAGIFDVSHMGRFYLSGSGATENLERLVTTRISDMEPGMIRYTVVCNPEGGIKDDILVASLQPDVFLLVVNASNREKLLAWFNERLRENALLRDRTFETGMIAIQGPNAEPLVNQLVNSDLSELGYYRGIELGKDVFVSRTGYTGEDGYETIVPNDRIQEYWKRACELGAKPIGLGARDTLRLEMGFSLYGHELSEEISPLEAGLKRVVHLDKGDFIGKQALEKERDRGSKRRRIGFQLIDRGIPREHCALYDGDRLIGESTSGGFSPTLQKGIGLALVENQWQPSSALSIEIRGKKLPIEIKKLPFVTKRVKNESK